MNGDGIFSSYILMATNSLRLDQNMRSPFLGFLDVQLQIAKMVTDLLSRVNPYLPKDMAGMESIQSLQRELSDYSAEENLRSNNLLLNTQNGINPYHVFLE